MTRQAFRQLVEEAIDTIPPRFARQVRNVAVIIENEPSLELLAEMGLDGDDTLLGLYQGTPLTDREWNHGNALPDVITLFQGPIESEGDGDEGAMITAVGETLIHELGHYFGLSEQEIMAIEERYWRGLPFEEDDDGLPAAEEARDP